MNKLFVFGVLGLLLVSGVGLIYNYGDGDESDNLFQGPVPIGYDLNYFRQTSETINTGDEYTPSQNLAIMEGRFDDVISSIEEMQSREVINGNR